MNAKYWIKFTTRECPICGRGGEYRERQYTEKPKDPAERYKWVAMYDWCNAL